MRTTITLTPEADSLVQKAMRERGLSFKDAVNEAIIAGLGAGPRPFDTPTSRLGRARGDLDHALRLAGDLEDEHLLRKLELGK